MKIKLSFFAIITLAFLCYIIPSALSAEQEQASPSGNQPEQLNPNGLQAFEVLGQFLEEDGWHPQPVDGTFVYRTAFTGDKNGPGLYEMMIVLGQKSTVARLLRAAAK